MPAFENSDLDMFSFFEMTPDLVCIAGRDGFFRRVNRAVIDKLEYSLEELFARPISSFIFPEDAMITQQTRELMLNGSALINFENRYVAKSGKIVWLHWTSFFVPDKELVFAIAKDVTHKKLVEQEMNEKYTRFKGLAYQFKNSIEKDRKYFAVELHEEIAQLASVIKMDLDSVTNKVDNERINSRIDHASTVCELMIQTIRKMSFELSPHMLDDLGLNETLKWLCKDFSVLNQIPCEFESDDFEHQLTSEEQIDFFRVCQEALKNVMRHAQASRVNISIRALDNKIFLSIKDDGIGFDANMYAKGAGLPGMQGRIASINGHFSIESSIGKGTTISVSIKKDALVN
jgi:PAS domain S-box-containing protein